MSPRDVVTGGFSYTGKYIVGELLGRGREVSTLTGHPRRPDPFGGRVPAARLDFDNEAAGLARALQGADVLYNTYWIRFERGALTFRRAVENSRRLIAAAREAGVRRVVHVSITNPSELSPLPYFWGKALVERALRESELSYAILRPTVVFGPEDILLNNIAWLLRKLPVFVVPGSGKYPVQPVFVEDLARLAAEAGERRDNEVFDAVGPERYTFEDLVRTTAGALGRSVPLLHLPPGAALLLSAVAGSVVGDVVLTRDEVAGLSAGLLVSAEPPRGSVRFSDWARENRDTLGARYASELERHYR